MRYNDISRSVRLFFGARELFRKLGFKAEDLFFTSANSAADRRLHVFCTLKAQDKTFEVDCGRAEKSAEDLLQEYRDVAAAINNRTMSAEDLDRVWTDSGVPQNTVEFMMALLRKGFHLPCAMWHLS